MELWACSLALYASLGMAQNPAQFGRSCAVCHGGNGEGTDRAPALRNNRELRGASEKDIAALIKNGRGNMPAFTSLPEAQIRELATFVHSMNMDAFEMKPAGTRQSEPVSSLAVGTAPSAIRQRDAAEAMVPIYQASATR